MRTRSCCLLFWLVLVCVVFMSRPVRADEWTGWTSVISNDEGSIDIRTQRGTFDYGKGSRMFTYQFRNRFSRRVKFEFSIFVDAESGKGISKLTEELAPGAESRTAGAWTIARQITRTEAKILVEHAPRSAAPPPERSLPGERKPSATGVGASGRMSDIQCRAIKNFIDRDLIKARDIANGKAGAFRDGIALVKRAQLDLESRWLPFYASQTGHNVAMVVSAVKSTSSLLLDLSSKHPATSYVTAVGDVGESVLRELIAGGTAKEVFNAAIDAQLYSDAKANMEPMDAHGRKMAKLVDAVKAVVETKAAAADWAELHDTYEEQKSAIEAQLSQLDQQLASTISNLAAVNATKATLEQTLRAQARQGACL